MKGRARGVTLIEVLIAVSLLSVLTTGVLIAIRLGLDSMQKANTRLMANRRAVRAQQILEQEIAGFMPEYADCMAVPGMPPARIPFFQGEPQSMRFVSSYSIGEAARGYPRIVEFQVIEGEERRGVRLVVNEHLYTGAAGAGLFCLGRIPDPATGRPVPQFRPIEVGPASFVLADKLAYCRFLYRETAPPPVLERWTSLWTTPMWPNAVRIEMAPLEGDSSRIRVLALTAPVRVNRLPFHEYTD